MSAALGAAVAGFAVSRDGNPGRAERDFRAVRTAAERLARLPMPDGLRAQLLDSLLDRAGLQRWRTGPTGLDAAVLEAALADGSRRALAYLEE